MCYLRVAHSNQLERTVSCFNWSSLLGNLLAVVCSRPEVLVAGRLHTPSSHRCCVSTSTAMYLLNRRPAVTAHLPVDCFRRLYAYCTVVCGKMELCGVVRAGGHCSIRSRVLLSYDSCGLDGWTAGRGSSRERDRIRCAVSGCRHVHELLRRIAVDKERGLPKTKDSKLLLGDRG